MTAINWPLLIVALRQAEQDYINNVAPPAGPALTRAQLIAALTALQAKAAPLLAALTTHRGIITASVDVALALEKNGVTLAGEAAIGIEAIPGALATFLSYAPMIIGFLQATAPQGGPGSLPEESSTNFEDR